MKGRIPNHVTGMSSRVLVFLGFRTLVSYFIAFLPKDTDVTKLVFDGFPPFAPNFISSFLVPLKIEVILG